MSGVIERDRERCCVSWKLINDEALPDKFIARASLSRRSAVVRGAVDTGRRRNNTVGSAEKDEID